MTAHASPATRQTCQLRDAVSGDLTGLEGRAQRLADRLAGDAQLLAAAYADSALTRTNHVALLTRLRNQLDTVVEALDASAAHRKVP